MRNENHKPTAMKNTLVLLLFSISMITKGQSSCYQLIWSDEFNGSTLDQSKWGYELGDGCPALCQWGNSELEYYTNRSENVRTTGGNLIIEARKENYGGRAFTSGKITTKNKFDQTYGRFEARMKLPAGNGVWPAFWMLRYDNNWPMTGEIDIMENRGDNTKLINGTLHYGSAWPANQHDGSTYTHSEDLSQEFHVYAVEWDANSIKWYFDNTLFKTVTRNPNTLNPPSTNDKWPWEKDFYIILNNAIGGWYTGVTSYAQVNITKGTFEIDYVRVYSLTPRTDTESYAGNVAIPGKIEAENFDKGCAGKAFSDTEAENRGGLYRSDEVDIEACTDAGSGYNVGYIETGEWMNYTVNVDKAGTYFVDLRLASDNSNGSYAIWSQGKNLTGTVNVTSTGGWQTWQSKKLSGIYLNAGVQTLKFSAVTGGFNLNHITFTADQITSVLETESVKPLIYPNPFAKNVMIQLNDNSLKTIQIFNLEGSLVDSFTSSENEIITGENLKAGVYFIQVNSGKNSHIQKIIKY